MPALRVALSASGGEGPAPCGAPDLDLGIMLGRSRRLEGPGWAPLAWGGARRDGDVPVGGGPVLRREASPPPREVDLGPRVEVAAASSGLQCSP
jgi:hypothetical protein